MKPIIKYFLITCAVVLGAIFALAGFLWWSFDHVSVQKSSGPTSRAKASSHVPFALPESAHDVEYSIEAGGLQYYACFVRFVAPSADCRAAAEAIFADRAKTYQNSVVPKFGSASHPSQAELQQYPGWFRVDQITNGVETDAGGNWGPHIWIDEDRGIFYYFMTD